MIESKAGHTEINPKRQLLVISINFTKLFTGKDFQELRDKLKAVFPRPQIELRGTLLAPPLSGLNYSVIGQAFDYLLRFLLEHRYQSIINSSDGWVADTAFNRLNDSYEKSSADIIEVGTKRDVKINRVEFLTMLKDEYSASKENYERFIKDGILNESLMRSALFLARLDIFVRSGIVDANIGNESQPDIQDLTQIVSLVRDEDFKAEHRCILNPDFGEGSQLVGGADADLIIDDTLIEIKTSKILDVEREFLNQLIGYYILSLIGGVNDDKNLKPIKNIAIYFARHAVLWKIPIAEMADEKAVLEFKDWFYTYVNEKVWRGRFQEINRMLQLKKQKL